MRSLFSRGEEGIGFSQGIPNLIAVVALIFAATSPSPSGDVLLRRGGHQMTRDVP